MKNVNLFKLKLSDGKAAPMAIEDDAKIARVPVSEIVQRIIGSSVALRTNEKNRRSGFKRRINL
jgi:hypothetical protein